ncbi:hypothetical protein AGMMS50262_01800 [Bacteroidia bacterium]|nr:hypothetical protein AGMMS50262_01800 [Bacteroidia bacterium]
MKKITIVKTIVFINFIVVSSHNLFSQTAWSEDVRFGWDDFGYSQPSAGIYNVWNTVETQNFASLPSIGGFIWESNFNLYQWESDFNLYQTDFLTMNSNWLFRNTDSGKEDGWGVDTSNNELISLANDVPLGDGELPLLLAAAGWVMIVVFKKWRVKNGK